MPFGAEVVSDGVRFRLWAPKHDRISLNIVGDQHLHLMRAAHDGWHELTTGEARPGSLYQFVLPDGMHVPDPASRFQPLDVHGPSEVINPAAYVWGDADWRGRPWEECVIYELHVGAFTPQGTFRAAIARLDFLRDLGVSAVELMPIADFPGRWNWGYDGVLLFAPDSSYGRPEDLKAFIDAAHQRNIAVLLDVVYNHFGPNITCRGIHRSSPKSIRPPGAPPSTSMARARKQSAKWLSTMHFIGSMSSIWTACGSMRFTRLSTTARSICWT
jgi:malto-oligosyltrehalose trehalohydrolase